MNTRRKTKNSIKRGVKADVKASNFGSSSPVALVVNEHKKHFRNSLFKLGSEPFASLMTVIVIAIALTLPACLYLIVQNGNDLSSRWQSSHNISVYVSNDLNMDAVKELGETIQTIEHVESVKLITADDALKELGKDSELELLSEALSSNPLPHTLLVTPASTDDASVSGLSQNLEAIPNVDSIQLDSAWLVKLKSIMTFLSRLVWFLGVLLALGVFLIVFNTVRLHVNNRRNEIEVKKLIGASDSFVRRPFLYTGFWYGFLGAVLAWILIMVMQLLSKGPLNRLLEAYASTHELSTLGFIGSGVLLLSGSLLALLGAWIASNSSIRDIEPQ